MPAQGRRLQRSRAGPPRTPPYMSTSLPDRRDTFTAPTIARRMNASNSTIVIQPEDSEETDSPEGSYRGVDFARNRVYDNMNGTTQVTYGPIPCVERQFKILMNSVQNLTRRNIVKMHVTFSNLAEFVSKPKHHTNRAGKSLLKGTDSNRLLRPINFDPSVEGMGVSAPAAHDKYLNIHQLTEKDLRLKFFDQMFMQLEKIFMKGDYLLTRAYYAMPTSRREIATEEAFCYWESLLEGENKLRGTRDDQERQMGMHMMHCAALIIYRGIFRGNGRYIFKIWNPKFNEDMVWEAAMIQTNELLQFFAPFERKPLGKDHLDFAEDIFDLCVTVAELRILLNPTSDYKFGMYFPLCKPTSERRFKYLKGKARLYETLNPTSSSEGTRKVYLTLCGSITRQAEDIRKESRLIPKHYQVCERKAVVVGYFPDTNEQVGEKGFGYGKTGEDFLNEARVRGLRNQQEVEEDWDEEEVEECWNEE